jgi:hypothetical protein
MKKNDKLVVLLGVIVLIIASIGIYVWVPDSGKLGISEAKDFVKVTGKMVDEKDLPSAVLVSDDDPFYSLIATPLAVNYDQDCNQRVIPLLMSDNVYDPDKPVQRVIDDLFVGANLKVIDDSKDAKEVSIEIADKYWESSEGAIIVGYDQAGYNLSLSAIPLASYLSIPVIVTDEVDEEVNRVLSDLGVEVTMVFGEDLDGFGKVLKFDDIDEIVDTSLDIINEKFKTEDPYFEIDYVTLANPLDAFKPKVLDTKEFYFGPEELQSFCTSQLVSLAIGSLTGASQAVWEFEIPEDYKYALVKFEGVNHNDDDAESLGDSVNFLIGVDNPDLEEGLQQYEMLAGGRSATSAGIPIRDANGEITKDRLYTETVLYGRGGEKYTITAVGTWLVDKTGEVSAKVVIEDLENPNYALMKNMSTIAPYLTAYRKGILFATPEFAFTADDDVLTDQGNTCPGIYVAHRNNELLTLSNRHVYDNIHTPLNKLLAKMAGIEYNTNGDVEFLREHYANNPAYIAIIGGHTMLPQLIYQNEVEPFGDFDGDGIDDTPYYFDGGTMSDNIYANIDPNWYDWTSQSNDKYSEWPYLENNAGRITGWDVQDASALVSRTIFYEELIKYLGDWKDNFGLLVGGGTDFQSPPVRMFIYNLMHGGQASEPLKLDAGYAEMVTYRMEDYATNNLGFNVQTAMVEEAMAQGLSDEAIDQVKKNNLLNRLFFRKMPVRKLVGEGNVKGSEIIDSSNFLFINGHGSIGSMAMYGNDIVAAGIGGKIPQTIFARTIIPLLGGFFGPGYHLTNAGTYGPRSISNMELDPSFVFIDSCFCGKINGIYPENIITQAFLHSGCNAVISSTTGSNIAGGYLEPKNMKADIPPIPLLKYWYQKTFKWPNGEYQDAHFGGKLYEDITETLNDDETLGFALRQAKNNYLGDKSERDWELWWSPPLPHTGSLVIDTNNLYREMSSDGKGPKLPSKYTTYYEFTLFGDPAFNPYTPND